MKKYRVTASYTVYCYATVGSEDKDQASKIAWEMDGGDFEPKLDADVSDWHIGEVREIIE